VRVRVRGSDLKIGDEFFETTGVVEPRLVTGELTSTCSSAERPGALLLRRSSRLGDDRGYKPVVTARQI